MRSSMIFFCSGTPKFIQNTNGGWNISAKSTFVFAFNLNWNVGESNLQGPEPAEQERKIVNTGFTLDLVYVFLSTKSLFFVFIPWVTKFERCLERKCVFVKVSANRRFLENIVLVWWAWINRIQKLSYQIRLIALFFKVLCLFDQCGKQFTEVCFGDLGVINWTWSACSS